MAGVANGLLGAGGIVTACANILVCLSAASAGIPMLFTVILPDIGGERVVVGIEVAVLKAASGANGSVGAGRSASAGANTLVCLAAASAVLPMLLTVTLPGAGDRIMVVGIEIAVGEAASGANRLLGTGGIVTACASAFAYLLTASAVLPMLFTVTLPGVRDGIVVVGIKVAVGEAASGANRLLGTGGIVTACASAFAYLLTASAVLPMLFTVTLPCVRNIGVVVGIKITEGGTAVSADRKVLTGSRGAVCAYRVIGCRAILHAVTDRAFKPMLGCGGLGLIIVGGYSLIAAIVTVNIADICIFVRADIDGCLTVTDLTVTIFVFYPIGNACGIVVIRILFGGDHEGLARHITADVGAYIDILTAVGTGSGYEALRLGGVVLANEIVQGLELIFFGHGAAVGAIVYIVSVLVAGGRNGGGGVEGHCVTDVINNGGLDISAVRAGTGGVFHAVTALLFVHGGLTEGMLGAGVVIHYITGAGKNDIGFNKLNACNVNGKSVNDGFALAVFPTLEGEEELFQSGIVAFSAELWLGRDISGDLLPACGQNALVNSGV